MNKTSAQIAEEIPELIKLLKSKELTYFRFDFFMTSVYLRDRIPHILEQFMEDQINIKTLKHFINRYSDQTVNQQNWSILIDYLKKERKQHSSPSNI